jgi:hypothetical protein
LRNQSSYSIYKINMCRFIISHYTLIA